jgi:hypothetical protein
MRFSADRRSVQLNAIWATYRIGTAGSDALGASPTSQRDPHLVEVKDRGVGGAAVAESLVTV